MTTKMVGLLRQLISAELDYRTELQQWTEADEEHRGLIPLPETRVVKCGCFAWRTAEALVRLGLAEWVGVDLILVRPSKS